MHTFSDKDAVLEYLEIYVFCFQRLFSTCVSGRWVFEIWGDILILGRNDWVEQG